jgi:hypothetical protein
VGLLHQLEWEAAVSSTQQQQQQQATLQSCWLLAEVAWLGVACCASLLLHAAPAVKWWCIYRRMAQQLITGMHEEHMAGRLL